MLEWEGGWGMFHGICSLPPVTHPEHEHSGRFMLLVFITADRHIWVPSEAARRRKKERKKQNKVVGKVGKKCVIVIGDLVGGTENHLFAKSMWRHEIF